MPHVGIHFSTVFCALSPCTMITHTTVSRLNTTGTCLLGVGGEEQYVEEGLEDLPEEVGLLGVGGVVGELGGSARQLLVGHLLLGVVLEAVDPAVAHAVTAHEMGLARADTRTHAHTAVRRRYLNCSFCLQRMLSGR